MSHPTDDGEQNETNRKRRIALIMTNSFSGTNGERTAAAKYDHDAMMSLWRDELNCEVFKDSGMDLSAQEMLIALGNLSNIQEEFEYVVIIISTHGGLVTKSFADSPVPIENSNEIEREQTIGYRAYKDYAQLSRKQEKRDDHVKEPMVPVFFGNDYRPVREKEMKEMFYNDSAIALQDVPKIFILNYCRGDTIDCGVIRVPRPAKTLTTPMSFDTFPLTFGNQDREIQPPSLMPLVSDAIAIYATQQSTAAWQYDPDMGSWLISAIKKIFQKHPGNKDLVELMTEVNREMKNKTTKVTNEEGQEVNVKAMSVFESSLTEKVYLKHSIA